MFLRLFHLKINPEYLDMLQPFHDKIVIPELQKIEGCLFAGLIVSNKIRSECVSMTLWKTREQAEAYEQSEAYRQLFNKVKPFLSESAEWKVRLSNNLELKYEPIKEEPILKEFRVMTQSDTGPINDETYTRMYVRLVSVKLQEGKMNEFRQKYREEIVPILQTTKGCRYIYLTESLQEENQVISMTIWDSKEDADEYEKSGLFSELIEKVKDTFSHLYQWKVALEKDMSSEVKTSEDLKVDSYGLVSGKRFS